MKKIVSDNGIEYYTVDGIKNIQNQMFRLLQIIDSICRENGLEYFLDGGTAIGAYRHGGFIPWDDDLDISMLKSDYLKLVDVLRKMDKSKYFLFDYELNMHCCTFFGEYIHLFGSPDNKKRHIRPIKIDIRPLNVIENTEKSVEENRVFRELANYLIFGKCSDEYKNVAIEFFENNFGGDKSKFLSFYNLQYGLFSNMRNALLVHPYLEYTTTKTYRYDDFFPIKKISFEGMSTFVPATDSMFAEIYGDYMKLPKISSRKPENYKVFYLSNINPIYKYLFNGRRKKIYQRVFFMFICWIFAKKIN